MQWKSFVRSGIRTHAHIRGPEHSLRHNFAEKVSLESGALDRSAILTTGLYQCMNPNMNRTSHYNKHFT